MGDTTQELILEQLRNHSDELRQIRSGLESLIRVEEKQLATDTKLNIMTKRCDEHDQRLRNLESSSDKNSHLMTYIERAVIWLMAAGATFIAYKIGI